ncbi:right-handed parallel beta-helix repeat-containing protein [Flavobacteriaceae bacterium]|nr:right-handed parallel beta-helix repeat-containing protein [Flavobacteriaceae bacterium]
MKKRLLFLLALIVILAVYFLQRETLPSYSPSRDYVDLEAELVEQFILAKDSSVIELPEGHFLFSQSLSLDNKSHLTIKGQGMDKTVLSFKGQTSGAEGIKITNSKNIVLEDFAIEDAVGDNLKISDSDSVVMRRIRSAWTGQVSVQNGAYALYPVLCSNVLIEECEAIGSSDAGIYVGQSNNVIIRNNKAFYNVAGIESENSTNVEIYGNEAYENTSGLLIFNLPELTVYGSNINAHHNKVYNNNLTNFAVKGSIISAVPKGAGVVIMATKDVQFHNNVVENHKTVNLCVVSYEIFAADEDELGQETVADEALARGLRAIENDYAKDDNYNPYPGRVSIHDNTFNNANLLPTFSNDFGLLWLYKNKSSIPDIAYDGIISPDGSLQDDEHKLCIRNNANASFVYLDASHDFEGFTSDKTPFDCKLNE